jgi:hypothetical protein
MRSEFGFKQLGAKILAIERIEAPVKKSEARQPD